MLTIQYVLVTIIT